MEHLFFILSKHSDSFLSAYNLSAKLNSIEWIRMQMYSLKCLAVIAFYKPIVK